MGGKLLSSSPTIYGQHFESAFPYYLSIGMTPEQYWEGDPWLVKAYREADVLSLRRSNFISWLNGKYVYEAFGAISPVLHAFAKKGTKAEPYPSEPYPIGKQDIDDKLEKEADHFAEKGRRYMEMMASAINTKMKLQDVT